MENGVKYALIFGGLGVLGLLAGFIFATMYNGALENAAKAAVAQYQAQQADAAAAHSQNVIVQHQEIDTEAENARVEIKAIDQSGADNPPVGPRVNAAMRRMYARQVQRDTARRADSRPAVDPAPVAR